MSDHEHLAGAHERSAATTEPEEFDGISLQDEVDEDWFDVDREQTSGPKARRFLLVVGVLATGIFIGRATAPNSDAGVISSPAVEEQFAFPAGDMNREAYWGLVGFQRSVADTFDRPDNRGSLGSTGTGEAWAVSSGIWSVDDDVARLRSGDPGAAAIVTVPGGSADSLVEVTMSSVEQGAGLVYRFVDSQNHWAVTVNPSVGSWSVVRTIDGDAEVVGELAAPTGDGATITITQNETTMRFLVDAREYLQLDDETFVGESGAGLIVAPDSDGTARWDRFLTMAVSVDGASDDGSENGD